MILLRLPPFLRYLPTEPKDRLIDDQDPVLH